MDEILPNLYCIMPDENSERMKPVFLVVRPQGQGNVLFGNGLSSISKSFPKIESLGKVLGVYIGDRHHGKSYSEAAQYFNVPYCCSAEEAKVMKRKNVIADEIVEYKQYMLYDDIEVIPTPGHTPGALSYLWHSDTNNVLFIGDTIVPVDNEWKIWVSKKGTADMLETMERLRNLDFNYIISDSFAATGDRAIKLSASAKEEMIESVIRKLAT